MMGNPNRVFGLVMAGCFGALALARFIWAGSVSWWVIGAGLGFLMAGLVVPAWLEPVRVAWTKLATLLGRVNSRVLLTVVFAALITPLALVLRLMGQQPIRLEFRGDLESYWHSRKPEEFEAMRMERQF